jgi:hypothetical protein
VSFRLDTIPPCGQYWEWERPDVFPKGEGEASVLYTNVGAALSAWEDVEYRFAEVFSILLDANADAAERVFGALEGISAKIEVLEQGAQSAFRQRQVASEFREAWAKLKGHYQGGQAQRNKIAHGQVLHVRTSAALGQTPNYLLMPRYNAKKSVPVWEDPPQKTLAVVGYWYTSADVSRFKEQFFHLATWAHGFAEEYSEKYPRRP